jgi:hypothetical protein
MINSHLEHLKNGPEIRNLKLGDRLQFPEKNAVFLTFKYGANEKNRVVSFSKSDRYTKLLINLLTHYPAWKCNFDLQNKEHFFLLFGRTSIMDLNGYIVVRIGHPDDNEFATFLAAEILYHKNLSNIEVHASCKPEDVELGKTARVAMKKDLHSFKINTENVKTISMVQINSDNKKKKHDQMLHQREP